MFLATLCLFNAVIIYIFASDEVCTPLDTNIRRIQEYNDKRITESSTWTTNLSMVKCLEKCYLDHKCVSVNLIHGSETCNGFNRPFEGLVAQAEAVPGYKLYETTPSFLCTTNEYCSTNFNITYCYENRCRCPIGYSFDGATCRMLTECVSFSDVYSLYPRCVMYGNDHTKYENHTLSSCADLCINDPLCEFADFVQILESCFTNRVTWFDVSERNRDCDNEYYISIQRECNW